MLELDELDGLRSEVREWATTHIPPDWEQKYEHAPEGDFIEFQRELFAEMREAGYATPHWEPEHGGFSLPEQVVIFEEMTRAGIPNMRLNLVAINHAYATLLHAGSEEQKAKFIPAIREGQTWCQGFSEPGAGSDLASLRTRAVRDGDEYVVNGQKIWSSGAYRADMCLLLVRTDPTAPKRKGITFLLMDMHTPGIEIRPIKQATGMAEFCEVFLTDVRIPVANRVGEENEGWKIAQTTLSTERGPAILELAERLTDGVDYLVALAQETELDGQPAIDDVAVRESIGDFGTKVHILRRLCRNVVSDMIEKGGPGPEASIIKLFYSELLQNMMRFGMELAGLPTHRYATKSPVKGWESGAWLLDFLDSYGWTIGGGTSEIQRTVVAERVLGLPRDPSVA